MFSFILNIKRRIKRLLKVESESRLSHHSSFHSRTFKLLLLIITSFLVGIFYPGESLFDPFDMPRRGEIAREDILAPFTITVFKTERELKDEVEDTKLQIPLIIDFDTLIAKSASQNLNNFLKLVDSVKGNKDWEILREDSQYMKIISDRYPMMSESAIIQSFQQNDFSKLYNQLIVIYQNDIYQIGVLPDHFSLPELRNKNVLIRRGNNQNIYNRDKLYTIVTAHGRLLTAINKLSATDIIDEEYYYKIGRIFIHPNLRVNMPEYNRRLEEALGSISKVKEVIEQYDPILRAGQKINERQQRILQEMVRIQRNRAAKKGLFATFLPAMAKMFLVFAAFLVLYLFMFYFRRDIYKSNHKLLALFLVYALQLFLIYIASLASNNFEISIYIYPVALLPIIVTILFDAEVGILATLVLAFLLGILHRFDFNLTFMTMVVGTIACFTSRQVRKRSQFFRIMYSIAITFALFIFMMETLKLTSNADILTELGYGLLNGIITSLLVIGILPFFESLFSITTDITLLELSDLNHPILKRLALEAPGTFHHSIIVGNLTEAATKAIGGNYLLARVGAYFHDIGKIEIPEYFVENQLSMKSKHEDLAPSMSSIILSSHVKIGRRIGEEGDIPDDVLNFIEEHHGTMVQSYFYSKAIELGVDKNNEDKFRYPGPKPQTKETGVAMLADAVEAASRTLEDPKPARINNLIQKIINDRFQSGELDECPLTIRDLAKIKEAFIQILIGIFHHRIEYPKKEKSDE